MIPILYKQSETDFTTNGIGRLADAISCIVTEERHGIYELEMQYSKSGVHFEDLVLDNWIKCIPFMNGTPQLFRIYEVSKPINGIVRVSAEHVSYQLRMIPVMPFEAVGAKATLQALKTNAAEECPFSFWTDIESDRRYRLPYPDSIRGKLQGDMWSINQNFSGDYEFDNYTVKLWQSRGSDKGVVLRYGKNITDLKQEENIQNTYTGIVPYWYGFVDGEQEAVYLPEKVMYSDNVDNFPYKRTITVDFTEDFEEKPTEAELRARGEKYLSDNDIGIPRVGIKVSFVELQKTEEYKDLKNLETVNMCDTITVLFPELGIKAKARVTRTRYDVLMDRYIDIYIGDNVTSLAMTIADQGNKIEEATDKSTATIKNALFSVQDMIDHQTGLITGNEGGFVILHDSDGDEKPDEILIMDTESINTAKKIWRWNKAGLGYSSTGYNGPYTSAFTADGKFNADFIMTGTLNAELINVINLVANKVQTINSEGTYKIEIENGKLGVYRKESDGTWLQRVALGNAQVAATDTGLVIGNTPPDYNDDTLKSRRVIALSPLQSFWAVTTRVYSSIYFWEGSNLFFWKGAKFNSHPAGFIKCGSGYVWAGGSIDGNDVLDTAPRALKNLEAIPDKGNLNSYTTCGSYAIKSNETAQYLEGYPAITRQAGILIVESSNGSDDGKGTWRYIRQTLIPNTAQGDRYIRIGTTGSGTTYSWSNWKKIGGGTLLYYGTLSSGSALLSDGMKYTALVIQADVGASSSTTIQVYTVVPIEDISKTSKGVNLNDETYFASVNVYQSSNTSTPNDVYIQYRNASNSVCRVRNVYGIS